MKCQSMFSGKNNRDILECHLFLPCMLSVNEEPAVNTPSKHTSTTKPYLYNFDPLNPHFNIVKLGFTGVYIIFLISAQKHRLWILVRTAYPQSMF